MPITQVFGAYIKVDEHSMFDNKPEIATSMPVQSFLKSFILPLLLVTPGLAICPVNGSVYGIAMVAQLSCGWSSLIFKFCVVNLFVVGNIYDVNCHLMETFHSKTGNPCTQKVLGCSNPSAPLQDIRIDHYTNSNNHIR